VRQYKVDSKFMYWLYAAVMPCVFLVAGVFFIYLAATKPSSGGPLWFWVVWFAYVLYSCHRAARTAHTIEVADNGLIRFTGLFRRTTVAPQDIVRVKAASGLFLEVKHTGGKIWTLQQITGLHEFLSNLKLANQNVTFKGC
jgi:hypothetical protein